jgi:DNA topoisomerase VI subunit A
VPTRACRRFVRRLADLKGLPVYVFVDGDPYGYSNIYRTLKVGSGNAAHLNEFFCVPQAHLLGITPQDIIDYDLPTHPLKEVDIKRAGGDQPDAQGRDPRRAAGLREMGVGLRGQDLFARQAQGPQQVPAVTTAKCR